MRYLRALALLVMFCAPSLIAAEEPTHAAFSPQPPGTIVQSDLFYIPEHGASVYWRAIVSKQLVGTGVQPFYQRYLSLYELNGNTYRLKYQSPRDGGPLSIVKKVDSSLWLPTQEVSIAGFVGFSRSEPQTWGVVVQSHEASADCGDAKVTVFSYDPATTRIVKQAVVRNPCRLTAATSQNGIGIHLEGPYYGPNAPLCCPTKNDVVAGLWWNRKDRKWVLTPSNYFELSAK